MFSTHWFMTARWLPRRIASGFLLFCLCLAAGCAAEADGPGARTDEAVPAAAESEYVPLYGDIKPLSAGDRLYVYTKGGRSADNRFIAMQTLQGVIARTDRPRLWIDVRDNTFIDYLAAHYGIHFDWQYADDFEALLGKLKPYTSGRYVLYDMRDRPSISAATTMAGLLDAPAIDTDLQAAVEAAGYTLGLDVRGKDCRWVWDNYREQLNDDAIIVHTNNSRQHRSAPYLRDWGPALKALDWWYDDEALSRAVYGSMTPASPVYGWQDPTTEDEGLTVKLHSEEGLYQVPSDWMVNLSVHAGMGPAMQGETFKQKAARQMPEKEDAVHYVTFIMSDMDNILTEIGTNSFYSSRKFYRNEHRGSFPMTWGMAPSLVELSPAGVDMWYRDATASDAFVAYCGLGYFYPNVSPEAAMPPHVERLGQFMDRADLRTLLLIDRVLPDDTLTQDYYKHAKWFTDMEQVRGLFYLEYIQYAPHGGTIFWFDGKPMVTARFDFRDEAFYPAVRRSPESLARSINELPTDPTRPEGYTFVTVHAWSRGMDDIHAAIQHLDEDVRVVDGETFIELLLANVTPDAH